VDQPNKDIHMLDFTPRNPRVSDVISWVTCAHECPYLVDRCDDQKVFFIYRTYKRMAIVNSLMIAWQG
jgi:hypothetical protein